MRLCLDFDGTVSKEDVVDVILENYADRDWRRAEEAWRAGRIGSRECLRAQMSLVRATQREINGLLDRVEWDDGFPSLLETCRRHAVPVHILSDGFDYCIARILRRAAQEFGPLLDGVRVCASHLEPYGEKSWRVDFPFFAAVCAHGCATCKPAAMRRLRGDGCGPDVFVGDGLSDRYAASVADVVFAKGPLADYCEAERIACTRYQDLTQVAMALAGIFHDPAIRVPSDRITRGRAWVR